MEDLIYQAGPWIYLILLLSPFVQEDVAVIGAATVSMHEAANVPLIFLAISLGLFASDYWKYWVGRFARRHKKADKVAHNKRVLALESFIKDQLATTLFIARFVPGTRIPTYLAAGFFKAPQLKYSVLLMTTGLIYVLAAFGLFHLLGEVAGEAARNWSPVIAICIAGPLVGFQIWKRRQSEAAVAEKPAPEHPTPPPTADI